MFSRPFSFQGRIRRLEFVISVVVLVAFCLTVGVVFAPKLPPWYTAPISLPFVWSYLAQGVKRCHDLGKPWWWFFIPFFVLWMLFAEGELRVNEYGPAPKK
jgi:uncharacterized membrane protein YhaH (DUF805 family)